MRKINSSNHKLDWTFNKLKYLPWIVLIVQYIWLIITFYRDGVQLIDSDMSGEMILANVLNEEGAFILSKNWFYSTELRVISNQLIYRLGLALFDNWHLARTFSMGLLLLILLGSYFFMTKNVGLNNLGIWGAILMISPLSRIYSWLIVIGNFYIMNLSVGFVCLGLMFILHRSTNYVKQILYTAILICLAFISGLGGIRMTVIFFMPLAATLLILTFVDLLKIKQEDLKWGIFKKPLYILAGAAVLAFIFNLIGYYINSNVLYNIFTFQSYNTINLGYINISTLLARFGGLMEIYGYQHDVPLFSPQGIHSFIAILFFMVTVLSFVIMMKLWRRLSETKQILFFFSTILLLSNMLINYITAQDLVNYLVPAFVYCLVVICMVFCEVMHCNVVIKAMTIAIALVFVASFYYEPYIQYRSINGSYEKYQVAQWLTDNGYKNGFATFWNSNIMTEHSNGQLEMYTIYDNVDVYRLEKFNYRRWLQKKSHVDNPPKGAVFVLISDQEYAEQPAFASDEYLVYSDYGYYVFAYDNVNQLYATAE